MKQDRCALRDLYHNPDPLVRLIGEPNETPIIIENSKVKGLVDSGAQVSSISDRFCQITQTSSPQFRNTFRFRTHGGRECSL